MSERLPGGIVAAFERPRDLLAAVRALRERGFAVREVYTPYALHELDQALAVRRSRLGVVTLAGGLCGALAAVALQVWTSAVDWPLNVGGKPAFSPLAFLPITFELAVLVAGLATAAAFLVQSRLYPRLHTALPVARTTDDRFALVTEGASPEVLCALLLAAGATEVREVAG